MSYYATLGVDENATQDEIKKAYRKLSKQFHPDVNPNGAEKFKDIADAYDTLGNEQKKKHNTMHIRVTKDLVTQDFMEEKIFQTCSIKSLATRSVDRVDNEVMISESICISHSERLIQELQKLLTSMADGLA